MAKKQKKFKELNLEVELLSERLRKLEEKETTNNPGEDTKNKVEEVKRLLKLVDQKIKDLERLLQQAQSTLHESDNNNEKFDDSWRLELHMKTQKNITPLKLNICEKHFYVNWRMKKNIASQNESNKFCNYFNSDKVCPFVEVGCKYKHEISENSKFDKNGQFKLCQFKHTYKTEAGKGIKCDVCEYMARSKEELSKHNKNNHEHQKFDVIDECEKQDTNEYICVNMAKWQCDHKCFDKNEDNELLGI